MSGKLKIILAFCLSIAILIIAGIYSYKSTNEYKSASAWVGHTQSVISDIENILLAVQEIETSQRGYVITGDDKYLPTYRKNLRHVKAASINLKNLIKDNPAQATLLEFINIEINFKILHTQNVIIARQKGGFQDAQKIIATGQGQNLMNKIHNLIDLFVFREKQLLSKRLIKENQNFETTVSIILFSVVLAIVIVVVTMYFFIMDYNRRVRSEKKLFESEMRIRKFLDSLPLGVSILRPGRISYYENIKFKTFFERERNPDNTFPSYIAGTNIQYPPEKLPVVRALSGEEHIFIEDLEIDKHGKRIPLRINAAPVRGINNEIEYAIAVVEDITDVKETEKNLIEAKKIAEQSAMLKEAFLANMSHEIRTPMNAIIGFTDLLLKKQLALQEKEYVQTIKNAGENLMHIINDILDVSKIDSGMMIFEEHPINIKGLFNSIHTMLADQARIKKLDLTFYTDANVPAVVLGDPVRLTQIMINLVGNAIKFTKHGSITVYAKNVREDDTAGLIEFSVKDTGIGIPEDKLESIFERFRQAEGYTTRTYGGTGLGLSIAKQLIELQGGSINIRSIVDKGSEFTFTLSFKKTDETEISDEKKYAGANDIARLAKLKILFAEDNPVNVKFILSLFSEYNIHPDVVENGKLAVEKIKNNNYDLILMDMEMPEMSGYEATSIIRNELKSDIPIIAMTAHAMSGEREKCLQLGMNEYISKPIKTDALFEKMLMVTDSIRIDNRSSVDALHKIIDLGFLVKSMRGKKDMIRETIEVYITQMPKDMSSIDDAMQKNDFTAVKKSTHRMKSTVSIMGITAMEDVLEQMELIAATESDFEKIIKLHYTLQVLNNQALREIENEKLNYI